MRTMSYDDFMALGQASGYDDELDLVLDEMMTDLDFWITEGVILRMAKKRQRAVDFGLVTRYWRSLNI